MFRHVVMFRWNDGVGDEHVSRVANELGKLPALIPQIRHYSFGPDAHVNEGNFDFVVVADFDSPEDYLVYRDHPEHQRFIADCIRGRVKERGAVQYAAGKQV